MPFTMTPGSMTVGMYKGGIKHESADDDGGEESTGIHNNQMGTGMGTDDKDTRMLLSWMTGARDEDKESTGKGDTGKHTVDSGR